MGQRTTARPIKRAPRATNHAFAQYCAAREAALTQFTHGHRIQSLWRSLTRGTDMLLSQMGTQAGLTLVAVGGYGRGEMFPFSDIDLLVLLDDKATLAAQTAAANVLQRLWDMHLPISHAVRSVEDTIAAANADSSIATALMDARFITGNRRTYLALKKRMRREVIGHAPQEFVAAKLHERDQRHSRLGDSRFMLEPNIKEGKGGIRDLQTLTWLARYCYRIQKAAELVREDLLSEQEWRHYREAYLFFSTVRAHMHLLRGRADERLTFDLQTQIAAALAFPGATAQEKAEKFMLRYFQYAREVGTLTRIFCAVLEEENLSVRPAGPVTPAANATLSPGFRLVAGRLHFDASVTLATMPVMAVALFHEAKLRQLDIHPRAQLAIARALPTIGRMLAFEGKANQLFVEILLGGKNPEQTLRRMNEMGVLGALIPEFGRITGMMQYDGYHTYTVDEHTLVAVGNLAMIETGAWAKDMPLATRIIHEIDDRATLYLAMLCHDLAKGTGGEHAQKGEAIVARIAARLGMTAAQGRLAGWLVKHHLILSETAFKRDLDDEKTIRDFAQLVESGEKLRLLLLLTVADIKAVGPTIWNRWKAALMRDLYERTRALLEGSGATVPAPAMTHEILLQHVAPEAQHAAQQLLQDGLPAGWLQRPLDEQKASIEAFAAWQAAPTQPALVVSHDRFRGLSEITCCMEYTPTLFRDLAGVMAWIGASIVSARSMVLARGAMIATLGVQDIEGNSFADEMERLEPLPGLIMKACAGDLDFARELPLRRALSRGREVKVAPMVNIDNAVSHTASVLEVEARDRIGLLYDILGALAACQLQVMTAHIATYGKKAVDVFYVKDAYGIQIIHRAKLAQVRQALLDACSGEGHA